MTHLASNSRTTSDTDRPSASAFIFAARHSSSGMRTLPVTADEARANESPRRRSDRMNYGQCNCGLVEG
jgi:hypothetical protein